MINQITQDAEARMKKSIEALHSELAKMRTGRANTALLAHVLVPYYGADTPLSQVANVAVEDARTLSITPWEKNMVPAIEKAIMTADLGLSPATSGEVIRVPIPALTEERRKEMVRLAKQEAENSRVAIRNIRRDANNSFKNLLKDKSISEDEERGAQDRVQKITDNYIAEVEKQLAAKEQDIMSI